MCCFCRCYDVKNAPPLKMYIKYRDNEFSLHSRDERVLDALKVFSDGLFNALQRNASQRSLIQEPPDKGQSSYWNYTKSYLEYPVRGIRNFVGKRLLSQDWKTTTRIFFPITALAPSYYFVYYIFVATAQKKTIYVRKDDLWKYLSTTACYFDVAPILL